MECKFNGCQTREDKLIDIENDEAPHSEKFRYLDAILEQSRGFDLDIANWLGGKG